MSCRLGASQIGDVVAVGLGGGLTNNGALRVLEYRNRVDGCLHLPHRALLLLQLA